MRKVLPWILTLSILIGQLVKIPIGSSGGLTLLDIAVVFFCILGLFQIKSNLKKPPLFAVAGIIFSIVAFFSLVLTPLHLNTFEYLTSFLYTIRFCLYILLGWLIFSGAFVSLKENLRRVLQFSGIGLAFLGLLQFIFLPDLQFLTVWGWDPHFFRTVSTFLDPNFAGAYFVLTLLLLISLRRSNAGMIITYIALLTTFSRSSYLMFLISGLTLSFFKTAKILALSVILLFIGLLLGFQIYTQMVAKPRSIDRTKSASFRFNTWEQGITIFQKAPLLGVGYNSYRYALKEFNLADEQFLASHGSSSNDSSLLFVLATTGIIGLLSYLFFLFALIKQGWRQNFILVSALFGLVVHSFFANSLFYPPILAWIILTSVIPKK